MQVIIEEKEKEEILEQVKNRVDYDFLMKIRKELKEEILQGLYNRNIRLLVQEEVRAQLTREKLKVKKNEK